MKRNEILGERFDREDDEGYNNKRDFKRQELQHELGHESNNIQVVINGKRWKVMPGRGRADSAEEFRNLQSMKDWAARKSAASGKKWEVYLTGASPTVSEMGPGTDMISQQKIKSVSPDKVELQAPDGKITAVKPTDLQTDPKDPTGKKLQATVSAPKNQLDPGVAVDVTTKATIENILKLAGL